ncbi:MAG TPA: L-serine ammonia-lyase, iron-sulfur-dependent, subunit alpha [Bacillota bacterium]|nr:L-serine ammonia-lyase, iron-sulfur-dependent, subunit alpha [Fastidiosipila sp.]HPX92971.1 L-serine ammonia-lyase, iron-sulfur-dependent, subunit alpha [Bacillota bacterium]HQB80785.1 L-serine ammonia-lyase, iron-sulfur-dependent, subunit alpha [Bacillota bacterium]
MKENFAEIIAKCQAENQRLASFFLERELGLGDLDEAGILERMEANLQVMEQGVREGLKGVKSHSGLSGGDARRLHDYLAGGPALGGSVYLEAAMNAVAVNEVNASMGIICATPTAGSSGIVPGVLLACRGRLNLSRRAQLDFLITCGGCGLLIGNQASLSGAAGGCQAEVGSASAMAAAALVEAAGGGPAQSGHALAIALKSMLGLTCDPVASLVEVPCIKRNAAGAVNALVAAEMALAGVESRIPVDQVIEAMGSIGRMMPVALRETALGGLAQTPAARKISQQLQELGQVELDRL